MNSTEVDNQDSSSGNKTYIDFTDTNKVTNHTVNSPKDLDDNDKEDLVNSIN